ncbi:MAG TPA: NAD(P)H-dependent oxidoreductase subunit E [Spirochaetia bacterium]|nr:NAD(P)H-dependent oxidoreductase subunit E [Spirochaetia bacterium]
MSESKCSECTHTISIEEALERIDAIIDGARDKRGILIPTLQAAQTLLGYLPEELLKHVSRRLRIPFSEVAGVVSFYSFFSTVPRGEHLVRVCLGTACYVRGGKEVLDAFRDSLGIDVGETTEDRSFSLEIGRCFGACGLAPVVMIDEDVHQRVRPTKVREILAQYRVEAEVAK